MKSRSILLFVLLVLAGCKEAPQNATVATTIEPESVAEAANEKDPFLKELAALPPEKRKAFTESHHDEIKRIVGNQELLYHLQKIMSGTKKTARD